MTGDGRAVDEPAQDRSSRADRRARVDPREGEGNGSRVVRIGRTLIDEWSADRVPDVAAGVAFYAVLSLLPALLSLASALSVLEAVAGGEAAAEVQTEVLDFLRSVLTSEAAGTIDTVENLFTEQRPGLLTFSLLAALWTVSRAFAGLIRALDVVYDLDEKRAWASIRGTALLLALGSVLAGAVMLTLFVVGPLLGTGEDIAAEIGLDDQFVFLWDVLRMPLAFLVLVLWAATVFHIAPDHHTPWRWDLPGALLTAVLWLAFSGGMRLYLELAQAGNAVFGALGGALIVLLWFWLLSLATLIGGELNQVLLGEFAPVHGPEAPAEHAREEQSTDTAPQVAGDEGSAGVEGVAEPADEGAGLHR